MTTSMRSIRGQAPGRLRDYATSVRAFGLRREDFLAVIDGMEMDVLADILAPDDATLDLYCDRVASAVGRLSVRVFGLPSRTAFCLAHHLGRALQLTNILRDLDEDAALGRLYLPREGLLHAGISSFNPAAVISNPALPQVCAELVERARAHFAKSDEIMDRNSRRPCARRASCRDTITPYWICWRIAAFSAARYLSASSPAAKIAIVLRYAFDLMQRTVHIVGGGISGLSAACVWPMPAIGVRVHEAAQQVGGRCRSYFDGATNLTIDNGNHLVLSGNHSVLAYARKIGSEAGLQGPAEGRISVYRSCRQ